MESIPSSAFVLVFQIIVLIFSVMVHEISHGYMAERLGDPTARFMGRLTLNPMSHIDPFGSILLPFLLYYASAGAFVFGWAKPVPYDPRNLKDPKRGAGLIALAGPLANIALAAIFGLILRLLRLSAGEGEMPLESLMSTIVLVNVALAVFNLVPLPPLDGSKVLFALLPPSESWYRAMHLLERYGMFLLILFIFFGFHLIVPIMQVLYTFLAGRPH